MNNAVSTSAAPIRKTAIRLAQKPGIVRESRDTFARASTDAFGDYLRQIGHVALLSAEDEVDLARRIEVGVFAQEKLDAGVPNLELKRELAWLAHDGSRAKCRFVEANLRLVVSIAKRYSGRGVPIMDLVQDGNLGLIRAVEKYDFCTGYKFSTYATWWIRQSIHRGMADKSRMIRIPVHTVEKLNKIKRMRQDLVGTLDHEPTDQEVADECQLPLRDVSRLLRYDNEPISLQTPVGDGDGDIAEMIVDGDLPQPDEYAIQAMRSADISRYLDQLPPRERMILRVRFGLDGGDPQSLETIASLEGVTRERVRQLEKRALALLRVPCLERYLLD
ncbi:sigma-70 family RNA polymerase sigma factor [Glaciibacter superstes]|uniref:sigma-70 family RNA polymerase sigma factor n=1 Tax=Glaciibacter superstes TaxID=501023 RepID=UPI00042878E2|nr:sigma-70 family RNA polymerase sigma factor [Glaciibacter superstes]